MKKTTKFLTGILAMTMLFSLAACGGDEGPTRTPENLDGPDNEISGSLNIRLVDAGFGTAWLYSLIEGFNVKYPNVVVTAYPSPEKQVVMGEIASKNGAYDLYFSEANLMDYTNCLIPLDDVYSYQWENEEEPINKKISSFMVDLYKAYDGQRYCIPAYVAAYGMTYNTNMIDEDQIPVTTDELLQLCATLKGSGITPLIFSGGVSEQYYSFFYYQLYAQYEGLDAYNAAQNGQIINANGELVFDISSTYQQGALEAAQVVEDMLWYDNGYIVKTSTGLNFSEAQMQYLGDESAAMMYNGSWLLNEMSAYVDGDTFSMFKVPVISAIKDKCTTIENDAELAALITAIDEGTTALSGTGYEVNQADFDKVYEARNFCYLGAEGSNACIVNNADVNRGLAELFLKYMYSDKGIAAVATSNVGAVLPVDGVNFVDVLEEANISLTPFYEEAYSMLSGKKFCNSQLAAIPTSCISGKSQCFERQFGSQNAADRMRAKDSFNAKKDKYLANNGQEYWDALYNMGLITQEQHANKQI